MRRAQLAVARRRQVHAPVVALERAREIESCHEAPFSMENSQEQMVQQRQLHESREDRKLIGDQDSHVRTKWNVVVQRLIQFVDSQSFWMFGKLLRHRFRKLFELSRSALKRSVEIPCKRWKAPHWLWISVSTDGDVQLARPYINTGCVWMQYRQSVASCLALLGHLPLRGCHSDTWGAETEQSPNRDRCRNRPASSHVFTQPQSHA